MILKECGRWNLRRKICSVISAYWNIFQNWSLYIIIMEYSQQGNGYKAYNVLQISDMSQFLKNKSTQRLSFQILEKCNEILFFVYNIINFHKRQLNFKKLIDHNDNKNTQTERVQILRNFNCEYLYYFFSPHVT